MKNEQKKTNNSYYIYAFFGIMAVCAIVFVRGCGNDAGTAELYQRTDAAVGAVEKQHETIGRELDTAGGQLNAAGAAVGRADQFITASQVRVAENTAGLADCQRIVGECRKIVADCERIYAEVEEANRAGTESSR